jgi:hypothetical protein
MLVSLNKNPWLWNWIFELIDAKDPEFREYLISAFSKTRPEEIKNRLIKKLEDFGYKVKFGRNKDAIVVMKEEEYIFLKLKYS